MQQNDIICWWSGGVTSAVACKIAIDIFGIDRCRFILLDTKNEDNDTYRFKSDCEIWYGKEIETIFNTQYDSIYDVWIKHKSLNVAHGAICSSELKRKTRELWQKSNTWTYQVFGFDIDEPKRAKAMTLNHIEARPIYPLLLMGHSKNDCIKTVQEAGIEIPIMYKLGFRNNNCFKTGCVQGGIGYWQKIRDEYPEKFEAMSEMEHNLTKLKGKPVTMLRQQISKTEKALVFLKKHNDYPNIKCLADMKKCKVEPLFERNGFCGINDLSERTETEYEINYDGKLF